MSEENISRRGFLKAAAATAVAATATGAGAALLANRNQAPAAAPLAAPITNPAQTTVNISNDNAEVMSQLMSAQAENIRLQAELDAAQRRIEGMRGVSGSNGATVEELHAELNAANGQIGVLSGLIALYEQLEDVDLGHMVDNGLKALDTAVTDLVDDLPTLSEGLAIGRAALTEFEEQVPAVAAGRDWIEAQFDALEEFHTVVLQRLADVVDSAGDFLQMLGDWFQDLLRWLPFGAGNGAALVVDALTNLLSRTADAISNRRVRASQPFNAWFEPAPGSTELPLRARLILPLRNDTFAPASNVVARAQTMRTTYQTEVSLPARSALTSQQLVQQTISDYRSRHNLDRAA